MAILDSHYINSTIKDAMKCLNPTQFMGQKTIPCRQCMNCRINAQRVWAARIQLEGFFHSISTFATLTYAESDTLNPEAEDHNSNMEYVVGHDGIYRSTLNVEHLKNFRRRLQRLVKHEDGNFRHFGVGEYGKKTERPHYHIMLFGLDPDQAYPYIQKAWSIRGKPIGHIMCSEINASRSAYIAQYTVKKMVDENHPDERFKLKGRVAEFMRSSKGRPGGIGAPAVPWLSHTMGRPANLRQLAIYGDVWNSVRIEGRVWPLGEYMRKKIRENMGIPQSAPERAILFDHFDKKTGELFSPPLPETYCPDEDIAEAITPFARTHGKKTFIKKELPELTKKAAKLRRRVRKAKTTKEV